MGSPEMGSEDSAPAYSLPSDVPMPGRPLLHDGHVLIYPEGHVCPMCTFLVIIVYVFVLTPPVAGANTGFADSDPHHACGVCWAKFARPFNGLLARFFRPGGATKREAARLQRPLEARHSAPPALGEWEREIERRAPAMGRVQTRV
jgi:hypothetical protein